MAYIYDNYTFTINKTSKNIYINVFDNNLITFEKNITQHDLANIMTIDKFHIFIIKCISKEENYKIDIINNKNKLFINFILALNDFSICQDIILKLKALTNDEEKTIEIFKLKQEIKELKTNQNNQFSFFGKKCNTDDMILDFTDINYMDLIYVDEHIFNIYMAKFNNLEIIKTNLGIFGYILKNKNYVLFSNKIREFIISDNVHNVFTIANLTSLATRININNKMVCNIILDNIDFYVSDRTISIDYKYKDKTKINLMFNNCTFKMRNNHNEWSVIDKILASNTLKEQQYFNLGEVSFN